MPVFPLLLLVPLPQSDSVTRRDTTKLPELEIRVTRAEEPRARLPMAVGVLGREEVRRAQVTAGLDESLSRLPGVVVFNRYNFSLDQRISIRGAGSRASFGLRGVKVLLDGIPQTLPDGQTQLTNVELGLVDRVEVLNGSSAALYGNASGGVLSFTTENPRAELEARFRASTGSFGTKKWQGSLGSAHGPLRVQLALTRFATEGFRQHSAARLWQLAAKSDLVLDAHSTLLFKLAAADAPQAQNPGALTLAEYAISPEAAVATNISRDADKAAKQRQLALSYRWMDGTGAELNATVFGLSRELKNPLSTPPPSPPTGATFGTYNEIDRRVLGVRLAGSAPLRDPALRLTAGFDLQRMRDDRSNQRSISGVPNGQYLTDQREVVTEVGPFTQLHWDVNDRVTLLGAMRWDRLKFDVTDHLLVDGVDNSGGRKMEHASGSLGASLRAARTAIVYANVATNFESPTTTELVNTSNGTAGFNTALGPQRTRSLEIGARGQLGTRADYTLAVFTSGITNAIIQVREADGRAFFDNAGKLRNRGVEAGLGVTPWSWLALRGAYTFADYRFSEYRIKNGATTDTLDGKRLAGVPKHFLRGTLTLRYRRAFAELDQILSGRVFADDRNTQQVKGWRFTAVRLNGELYWKNLLLSPFFGLNNLFDNQYIGSVNINGAQGRILEPAPGRNSYVGVGLRWAGARP